MEKITVLKQAGPVALQEIALPFESAVVLEKCGRDTLPDEAEFARKGKDISCDALLFDLTEQTKLTGTAFLRLTFDVPAEGDYLLGIGGDWWHISWLDGKTLLDRDSGGKNNAVSPVCFTNHLPKVHLASGKHQWDIRFTRGEASAILTAAILPAEEGLKFQRESMRKLLAERRKVMDPFTQKREYMEARIRSGIEANRKGNLYLTLKDSFGSPVKQAHIKVRQKSHEFKTGANLFMLDEFPSREQNDAYKELFADAFNIATLPFYWVGLEPEKGKPRFAKDSPKIYRRPAPDLCLEYCEAHGIEPKAHCLNYAIYTPDWARGSVEYEKQCLRARFEQLAERYAARIPMWEVTNETFWDRPDDTSFFRQPDFVEWSFREAERCFPANTLVINEATARIWDDVHFQRDRSPYYMQIERALLKGARIDEIGMQYHMFWSRENELQTTRQYYDPERIYDVMDSYAKLGLPMHVTEMTIPAYSNEKADEEIQTEILRNLYSMWFSHEAMTGIIYWNLIDGFAFGAQGDMLSGENRYYGGLVRYDFTPKPAYYLIRDLFQKEWHTELELDLDGSGSTQFRGFYGKYELEITVNGRTVTKEVNLGKKLDKHITITL